MIKKNLAASPELLSPSRWGEVDNNSHLVQFYENDQFLLQSIREFLKPGGAAVVIATPQHRASLEDDLKLVAGLGLAEARAQDRYISLDAEETLTKFMVDGLPDTTRFFEYMGGLITRASIGRHNIRIFGEMVALLWAAGNQAGAICLEELWNNLRQTLPFTLFCGYPMSSFDGNVHAEAFSAICGHHGMVFPAESYALLESQDARLRAIAQLQQKAKSLEAEIARCKLLEKQKDELIGIISHELKTPVTSVKGYTQILQKRFRKADDLNSAELVKKMDFQLNKLIGLIAELLDATKIDGGKLRFRQEYFDFNELVLEIVEQVQFIADRHQIVTELGETRPVFADRERIGQVISNFVSNAVKYSPPATEITVKTRPDQANLTLWVQDSGIGIPQEAQARIFERFYRVGGEGRETYPGLGLGLYLSAEIINRHNGRIWFDSEKGKGSKFAFSIPLQPADVSAAVLEQNQALLSNYD